MDLNLIKKLVKIFNASDITELEVEKDGVRIKICKQIENVTVPFVPQVTSQNISQPVVENSKIEEGKYSKPSRYSFTDCRNILQSPGT